MGAFTSTDQLVSLTAKGRPCSPTNAAMRRASTNAFYEANAEKYADATMPFDTVVRIAWFASLLRPDARVLDAGCGSGRDLIHLKAARLRPSGLDISPSLVAIARRNSLVSVTIGDLRTPPFPPSSFEGVWAMASLLHLEPGETTGALTALRELLVPGGVLFASVKRGRGRVCDRDGRWFTLHDETGWAKHLRRAGLEVIEMTSEPPETAGATDSASPGWLSSLARRHS
jgi:SAM-dependent methyltransferase